MHNEHIKINTVGSQQVESKRIEQQLLIPLLLLAGTKNIPKLIALGTASSKGYLNKVIHRRLWGK